MFTIKHRHIKMYTKHTHTHLHTIHKRTHLQTHTNLNTKHTKKHPTTHTQTHKSKLSVTNFKRLSNTNILPSISPITNEGLKRCTFLVEPRLGGYIFS